MNILRSLFITIALVMLASIAMAKNPYKVPNNSRIILNGTVVTAAPTAFELDYGTGIITVEMDGWDWYTKSYPLLPGDRVTVYGRVDNDLYEVASIEAGSVYVKNLNTYFYANDLDEEDVIFYSTTLYPDTGFQLQGTIVDKNGREFTLDTGSRKIKIDTIQMPYNPLDDKGYQQLKKGDFVQVTGELDVGFFEDTEIMAETITTLLKDTTKMLK